MNGATSYTVSTSLGDALIDMYIKTFNDARKILEAPGLISTYLVFSFQYYEFIEDLFPGYFFFRLVTLPHRCVYCALILLEKFG